MKASKPAACLVIGGSGFVGQHLIRQLQSSGHVVHTLSRSSGFDLLTDNFPLDGIGHVFHLAARTGVVESWADPLGFFETNTYGTVKVLDQCRLGGCSLTFLSSFRNTDADNATNPYLQSKMAAERMCTFYSSQYGVRVVTLKLANIYGPGQSSKFLIPTLLLQLLDASTPEIVVQDLAPQRDYIHVDDVVRGIILSMNSAAGSTFDLGSGTAHSVEEVIQFAKNAAQIHKPHRATGTSRTNEIKLTLADTRPAQAAFGWEPKVSLQTGLAQLIESMRN